MRPTAPEIISFLQSNFSALKILFEISQKDSYLLEPSLYEKIISEQKLGHNKLEQYDFVLQQSDGFYKLNRGYTDFFEFILQKSALLSPERFKGYIQTIKKLFLDLQSAQDPKIILWTIQSLMDSISEFISTIEGQTTLLIDKTDSLKHNNSELSSLVDRINEADFWIKNLIKPLNQLLDRHEPDSITAQLNDVGNYANNKRLFENNIEIRNKYNLLMVQVEMSEIILKQNSQKMVRELLPLLDRIRENSKILSGFYSVLESFEQKELLIVAPPSLVKNELKYPYAVDWRAKVELLIEILEREQESQTFEKDDLEIDDWTPQPDIVRSRLIQDLPISNFYEWCYNYLDKQNTVINQYKYFSVASLLLEESFSANFKSEPKFEIELADAFLTLPIVEINELSE